MAEIGKRLKTLRESAQLSQAEIARMCGSNQSSIGKTENGQTLPSVRLLMWWADYFDVSLDYLCCRTDNPQGKLYECRPKLNVPKGELKQFVEMCFDPKSPMNARLKETLLTMMEDTTK